MTLSSVLHTYRERLTYRAARKRGESIATALYRVRGERAACAMLEWHDDKRAPANAVDVWTVDAAALAQHAGITLPPGATVLVWTSHDDDSTPHDAECYSPDDIAAWERGAWAYVAVGVRVTLSDGTERSDYLSGVEVGNYFPGDVATQVWETIVDMITETLSHVLATSPTLERL